MLSVFGMGSLLNKLRTFFGSSRLSIGDFSDVVDRAVTCGLAEVATGVLAGGFGTTELVGAGLVSGGLALVTVVAGFAGVGVAGLTAAAGATGFGAGAGGFGCAT